MADFQFARRLLDCHLSGSDIGDAFAANGPFFRIFSGGHQYRIRGLISAMIVLVPERTAQEFHELMPQLRNSARFVESFAEAIPLREGRHITAEAIAMVEQLLTCGEPCSATFSADDEMMDRILLSTAQPDHPLNAKWLHARLIKLPMPERDL